MPWIAVEMLVDAASAVGLSDAFIENGALSVDVADAHAGTELETPLYQEPGEEVADSFGVSRLTVLFDQGTEIRVAVEAACNDAGLEPVPPYRVSDVAEQDWVRFTQNQFSPIRVSSRIWVVPTWHVAPEESALNIVLDPGLAFGTGSHPTTRLCLQWLDENVVRGSNITDYGCGSGILAIAAAKLGEASVVGVDIDPHALDSSRYNATVNGVTADFVDAHNAQLRPADVVGATILSNPLKVLAPLLAELTRPGGSIVLSGILAPQAREVAEVYETWFEMGAPRNDEGWTLLSGVRRRRAVKS
jgi:ribosomal protein L11 methyltransferase